MESQNPSETRWNAICLHGALQTREVFDPLIAYFQESLPDSFGEAVAIDLPGHGGATDIQSRYTPDVLARYVLDTVSEAIFARPTIIVAQSFAGVAAMAVQKMREEISGVVMLDTPMNNFSAKESVVILAKKYKTDPKNYRWIPDFLKDYFEYSIETGFLSSIDYHDYIVDGSVPVIMITGTEKKNVITLLKKTGDTDSEANNRVITGTFDEITRLGRQYPGRVRLLRSAACFGDRDIDILKNKKAKNFKVYTLVGRGHNVLTGKFVPLIGAMIGGFAAQCLSGGSTSIPNLNQPDSLT